MVKRTKTIDETISKAVRPAANLGGENEKMALMWYFIGWHEKLKEWPYKQRKQYALEASLVTEMFPVWLWTKPPAEAANVMKERGIKLFSASPKGWLMLDRKGKKLSQMTGMRFYALFAFLVDSLAQRGIEDAAGFEFVKTAKMLIRRDKSEKK